MLAWCSILHLLCDGALTRANIDFSDLMGVSLRADDVQGFDISQVPSDTILEA